MIDAEWKALQDDWRVGIHAAAGRRVRRQIRDARLATALELVVALVCTAGAAAMAARERQGWLVAWAVQVGLLFAIALGFAVWNRRDALWPSSSPALDFLAQAELRCRRQLRTLRWVPAFTAVELLVVLSNFLFDRRELLWIAAALFAALCVPLAIWWLWFKRRVGHELSEVARLRAELERL